MTTFKHQYPTPLTEQFILDCSLRAHRKLIKSGGKLREIVFSEAGRQDYIRHVMPHAVSDEDYEKRPVDPNVTRMPMLHVNMVVDESVPPNEFWLRG